MFIECFGGGGIESSAPHCRRRRNRSVNAADQRKYRRELLVPPRQKPRSNAPNPNREPHCFMKTYYTCNMYVMCSTRLTFTSLNSFFNHASWITTTTTNTDPATSLSVSNRNSIAPHQSKVSSWMKRCTFWCGNESGLMEICWSQWWQIRDYQSHLRSCMTRQEYSHTHISITKNDHISVVFMYWE